MSTNGSSINVGTTATDVGDFTTLLAGYQLDLHNGWIPRSVDAIHDQHQRCPSGNFRPDRFQVFCRRWRARGHPLELHRHRPGAILRHTWSKIESHATAAPNSSTSSVGHSVTRNCSGGWLNGSKAIIPAFLLSTIRRLRVSPRTSITFRHRYDRYLLLTPQAAPRPSP